ncbi:hypothetical protein D3C86_1876880 [compost metagenome]
MQHRHSYPGADIEPDGYIQVTLSSFQNCTKHIDTEDYPYEGDGNIQRPFQLGIFFTLRKAHPEA